MSHTQRPAGSRTALDSFANTYIAQDPAADCLGEGLHALVADLVAFKKDVRCVLQSSEFGLVSRFVRNSIRLAL